MNCHCILYPFSNFIRNVKKYFPFPGFDFSDDTSESDSDDVVSWQPDWFSPSSDEEMPEDEEEEE